MIKLEPAPRVAALTKEVFLRDYKARETPVVIEQLTASWPARQKWSLDYLCEVAGDNTVPLYGGGDRAKGKRHQHAAVAAMKLRDYIESLKQGENKLRMFFYNIPQYAPKLTEDFTFPDIGLKLFSKLPVLFFGGKGAKVQMHFDIDLADILLCHFGGKKRVYLFAPEQKKYLYHVPFSFSGLFDIDIEHPDYERFPALHYLQGSVAELEHGDVLYIPPGYWHYIVYEDIGFSMALRAFPRRPIIFVQMLRNLVVIRTVEGVMRKFVGQPWNDRNERLAVLNTHRKLGLPM
ncbi:MAG: cupin-like domain-containing protein [Gammaproteobacteria bacterium]